MVDQIFKDRERQRQRLRWRGDNQRDKEKQGDKQSIRDEPIITFRCFVVQLDPQTRSYPLTCGGLQPAASGKKRGAYLGNRRVAALESLLVEESCRGAGLAQRIGARGYAFEGRRSCFEAATSVSWGREGVVCD